MKNLFYLVGLCVLFTSCSTTYTDVEKLDLKDGLYTFKGELFDGEALSMTRKNKVRQRVSFRDGKPVEMYEHSVDEGIFEEIKLENGETTLMSDLIVSEQDLKRYLTYYPDGSIESKTELLCETGHISECVKNGKSEEYDEQGNITKTEYYENGEKLKN